MQVIDEAYETNRFHVAYRAVYDYIATELSAVYLDVIKDRLYSDAPKSLSRRSAQVVLEHILETLVRQLAPILSFTCDEVWDYYPSGIRPADRPQSVLLAGWPELADFDPPIPEAEAEVLLANFKVILAVRDAVTKALEEARTTGLVGKSQEAKVHLSLPEDAYAICQALPEGTLEELCIVAEVQLTAVAADAALLASIEVASGQKCPRCWNYRQLGSDTAYPEVCDRCAAVLQELAV
jgi:isoleucyl-tRNA synthetase